MVAEVEVLLKSAQKLQELLEFADAEIPAVQRTASLILEGGQVREFVKDTLLGVHLFETEIIVNLKPEQLQTRIVGAPVPESDEPEPVRLTVQAHLRRHGGAIRLVLPPDHSLPQKADQPLIHAVARAHEWARQIANGEIPNQRASPRRPAMTSVTSAESFR